MNHRATTSATMFTIREMAWDSGQEANEMSVKEMAANGV